MVVTVREKQKAERIAKYKEIHAEVIESEKPIPWEYIAGKYGYTKKTMRNMYYQRILPTLRKLEAEQKK